MKKSDEPVVIDTSQVQGVLLSGHGKLNDARFILLRIDEPLAAKKWLADVRPEITNGHHRPEDEAVQIAFTYAALVELGVPRQTRAGFSVEFEEGMTAPHRSFMLGDSRESAPENWEWGGPKNEPVHILLMLYGKGPTELEALVQRHRKLATDGGLSVVIERETHTLFDGIGYREHFGFRDGVAQPRMDAVPSHELAHRRGAMREDAHGNTIKAGELLLGYENEYGHYPVSPAAGIDESRSLPEKTYGRGGFDLGKNGTYLVYRQLEQDVYGFWKALHDKVGGDSKDRDYVAAKMVGRWPSGAPLVKAPDHDTPGMELDDSFSYISDPKTADPHGEKCPFGSHIRRSNPRDSILSPDVDRAIQLSKRHRMVRRARPYGLPVDEKFRSEEVIEKGSDGASRGLNFICFNASIARQFEFVQHTWCNSPKFAELHNDPDPLIGEQTRLDPKGGDFTIPGQPVRRRVTELQRFVTTKGGAYFFMPSLAAIEYIAKVRDMTPLQKHVAFFDTDNDGIISIGDTYRGHRRLGISQFYSALFSMIINFALFFQTKGKFMQIKVENIAMGKHAFDTGIFDDDGMLDEKVFDELFSTATGASGEPSDEDVITRPEMNAFVTAGGDRGRPNPGGLPHWFSQRETELIFCLASDAKATVDGKDEPAITRRTLKDFYRGDLFPKIERLLAYKRVGGFGL